MKPLVSVIVTSKNEEKHIGACLRAIKNQSYNQIEIILSDSSSDDDTVEIARKYADKVVVKETNIPEGQNLGADYAHGEILVFGKADTLLSKKWIENAVNLFRDKDTVAVYGRFIPLEESFRARFFSELTNFALRVSSTMNFHPLAVFVICGENILAVKKKTFNDVGRFDTKLFVAEDKEIIKRLLKAGKVIFGSENLAYASFRRMEKEGYLKWYLVWTLYYIFFSLIKRTHVRSYKLVR